MPFVQHKSKDSDSKALPVFRFAVDLTSISYIITVTQLTTVTVHILCSVVCFEVSFLFPSSVSVYYFFHLSRSKD